MLHKLRKRAQDEQGFTLIELLVVILIIGILAAIAIPSFLNQREKAQDTEAKTTARTAQTAAESIYVENQSYQTVTPASLKVAEPALNIVAGRPEATLVTASGNATTYTIRVTSVTGGWFQVTRDATTGAVGRTCGDPNREGQGGCRVGGTW